MFRQCISLSGTALTSWAVISAEEARARALKLGELLGCKEAEKDDVNAGQVVRCLRTKPAEDIVRQSQKILDWSTDVAFPFVPIVENFDGKNRPFMITPPLKMLQNKLSGVKSKTWITGVVPQEGLLQALQMMVFSGMMNDLNENFEDRIWDYLSMSHIVKGLKRHSLGRSIRDFYFPGNESIHYGTLSGLIDLTSDAQHFYGLKKAVQLHSAAGKASTLVYRFGYNKFLGKRDVLGVPQGTDNELLFPSVFAGEKIPIEKEAKPIAKKLMRLLLNFITIEDPTPIQQEELDNVVWPTAKGENFSFLDILPNGEISVNEEGFYTERMEFWESIYNELQQEDPSNKSKEKDEL